MGEQAKPMDKYNISDVNGEAEWYLINGILRPEKCETNENIHHSPIIHIYIYKYM